MDPEIEEAIQKEILRIKEEELKKFIKAEAYKRIEKEELSKLKNFRKDTEKIFYEYFFFIKNSNNNYIGNNITSKIEEFKDKYKDLLNFKDKDDSIIKIKEIDQYLVFISEKIEFIYKDSEKKEPDCNFSISTIQLYNLFRDWANDKYPGCYIPTLAEIKFDLSSEERLGVQKQKGKWMGIKIKL